MVSLETIWSSSLEDLKPIFEAFELEPITDLHLARVTAAILYHNAEMLDPEGMALVEAPDFSERGFVPKEEPNAGLVDHFRLLAYYEGLDPVKSFSAKAFVKVADIIENYWEEITDASQLKGTKGVGEKSLAEITAYLTTGTSERLEALRLKNREKDTIINELMTVEGIGLKTALQLYEEGVRGIGNLDEEDLNRVQRLGLKYRADLQQRIPREEIKAYADRFEELGLTDFEFVGSYRRGQATSGDIDVIFRDQPLEAIVGKLRQAGIVIESLALGPRKFMGLARLGDHPVRRLDLRFFTAEEYPFGLLYNTGSKAFNVMMRQEAKKRGLTLNEYGLTPKPAQGVRTEAEIFGLLGFPFTPPAAR